MPCYVVYINLSISAVPPLSAQMLGADQPLSAGKEVALTCLVRGSRPPPVLTWMLDDRILNEMSAQPVCNPTLFFSTTKNSFLTKLCGKRLARSKLFTF